MGAAASSLKWLRTFLVVVLALLAPLALYFLLYAARQGANAERRGYRALGRVASNLKEHVDLRTVVLATAAWGGDGTSIADALSQGNLLEYAPDLPSAPDKSDAPETSKQDTGAPAGAPAPTPGETTRASGAAAPAADRISSHLWLGAGTDPRLGIILEYPRSSNRYAKAATQLRSIVDFGLASSELDGLIVRRQGSEPATQGDILFDERLPSDATASLRSRSAELCGKSGTDATDGQRQGTADAAAKDLADAAAAFRIIHAPEVKLGRNAYYVFCLPVSLQVPRDLAIGERVLTQPGDPLALTLIGLVETGRLRKRALELSATTFGMVGIFTAAAFLTLPYLKIRFMARRERMRALDMWLLAAAAYLGTTLGVLIIAHRHGDKILKTDVDAAMLTTGARMRDQVSTEAGHIQRQLEEGARALLATGQCDPLAGKQDKIGQVLASSQYLKNPAYPDFEALFCTDRTGRQLYKWMPRWRPTSLVSTGDYPYFARTMEMKQDEPFASEFDILDAKTSGLTLAVFATPINAHARPPQLGPSVPRAQRTGIVSLSTPMRSLMHAELPKPYQYAVLRDDKLLVASPGISSSTADFFADFSDLEQVATLKTVIRDAQREGSAPGDWRYRGRMHRVQAFKLDALSATLLVFYDKTLIEGVSGEVLVSSTFWIGLQAGACFLALLIVSVLAPTAFDWFWPTSRTWRSYAVGSLALALFAVALIAISEAVPKLTTDRSVHARWRALIIVFGPALALLSIPTIRPAIARWATFLLASSDDLSQAWRTRLYPRLYLAFGVLALIALAAVPTALMFSDALRAYHAAFKQFSAVDYARRREGQRDAYKRRFVEITKEQELQSIALLEGRIIATEAVRDRATDLMDEVSDFTLARPLAASGGQPTCQALFSYSFGPPSPQRFFSARAAAWTPSSSELNPGLRNALCAADANREPAPALTAGIIGFLTSNALPLLLLLCGMWAFVRSVASHILGLNFEGDGVLDRSADVLQGGRWLLLRPTATALDDLRTAVPNLQVVDLADHRLEADTFFKPSEDPKPDAPTPAPLLLLNVDARLPDQTWRAALLKLALGPPQRAPIFFESAIDPLHFLDGLFDAASAEQQAKLAAEAQQWALGLATMEKARYARPPVPPLPDGAGKGLSPLMIERLKSECQWDDVLLRIRDRLLARDDLRHLDWSDIVERILDLAEPHYRAMWDLCSIEERLTLIQLAQEGVVNPRAFDTLRRLRRRRLIRTEPRFQLMNESFRRFVLEAETPAHIKQWETPDPGQGWTRVQAPLLTLLFIVTGVLLYAQQPFFNSTVAVVAGAAGALNSLTGLIARARGSLPTSNSGSA